MKDPDDVTVPQDLRYTASHEWLTASTPHRLGITDFAQDQLGDITFVELPEPGSSYAKDEEFGTLESVKSVSSLYMPVSGTVTAVNGQAADNPELVNSDPYGGGWLVEIQPDDPAEFDALLTADGYKQTLADGQ